MNTLLTNRRRSGILAHITSLPSPYGIGDIGASGLRFLDFLGESGQSCWQFLPLHPTNDLFDNSPYMSTSAFAGSPLLLCPELLHQAGLVSADSLRQRPSFSPYTVDYPAVRQFKSRLLAEAFANFQHTRDEQFHLFRNSQPWLADYALFMALKEEFNDLGWFYWPEDIASRKKPALRRYAEHLQGRVDYYVFEQYIFHRQWQRLRRRAAQHDILLFGDIPIYVGLDSADVWANQEIFTLDASGRPTTVSGVPPDYFSATGQRWGNPLYRWNSRSPRIKRQLEDWWVSRFAAIFNVVDIARIDHFRGFESYWSIPAEQETAIDGQWLPGPGSPFFEAVFSRLGHLEIVAEDLGIITKEVHTLRDTLGFPGMKVLQFAFDGNPANSFLPHNFQTSDCVVYTGTHDNNTTVGWFLDTQLDDALRLRVKRLANRWLHDSTGIHDDLIYLALASIACLAVLPLQDLLGFGGDCRMNTPGISEGNWRWRCAPEFLSADLTASIRSRTELFGRYSTPRTAKET